MEEDTGIRQTGVVVLQTTAIIVAYLAIIVTLMYPALDAAGLLV